jgi:hypothetical protein
MMTLHAVSEPARSPVTRPPSATLRRCACGGGDGSLGECASCRRARTESGHAASTLRRQPAGTVRRQEAGKPKSNEEKLVDAAKKTGEAFLETGVGKDLKKQAETLGKDFVSSLSGKVITGAAAAGAVGYIVAKNSELPVGIPEIPLDSLAAGLKLKITWEGPVRTPKKAMLTFTWSPGAPATKQRKAPTEREKFRAETARMAKEQAEFRESMKPPEQRAAEDDAFWKAYWGGMGKYGLRPLQIPGVEQEKQEDETPTLRRSAAVDAGPHLAPAAVHDTIARPGAPLSATLRSDLESRFGHDFAHVRIHTDAQAAHSADAVGARAYTVGSDVVFGAGRWAPESGTGRLLLAHELAHVAQHDTGRDAGAGSGIRVGSVTDPLEAEAEALAKGALAGGISALAGGTGAPTALHSRATGVRRRDPALARHTDAVDASRHLAPSRVLRRDDGGAAADAEEEKEPELRTSTPRITGSKLRADGAQQLRVGAVDVLIKPDVAADADTEVGETKQQIEVTPKKFDVSYTLDAAGRIKTFEAPEQKVSMSIQTHYGEDVDPSAPSAYGRGTTAADIAAGTTSLQFHEGQHGLDYVQYLRDHPFPTFRGRKGMTVKAFGETVDAYLKAIEDYGAAMDTAVLQSGDCVGISIDAHKSGDPTWQHVCAPAEQPAEAAP